jgi:hypothetical protein
VASVADVAGKSGIANKLNPVLAISSSSLDIAKNGSELINNWDTSSTGEKAAAFAKIGADVANIAGAVLPPPAKFAAIGVSVGLDLVATGIENWDAISEGAGKAVDAVADTASKAVDAVGDAVGKGVDKAKEWGKKLIGGL